MGKWVKANITSILMVIATLIIAFTSFYTAIKYNEQLGLTRSMYQTTLTEQEIRLRPYLVVGTIDLKPEKNETGENELVLGYSNYGLTPAWFTNGYYEMNIGEEIVLLEILGFTVFPGQTRDNTLHFSGEDPRINQETIIIDIRGDYQSGKETYPYQIVYEYNHMDKEFYVVYESSP